MQTLLDKGKCWKCGTTIKDRTDTDLCRSCGFTTSAYRPVVLERVLKASLVRKGQERFSTKPGRWGY